MKRAQRDMVCIGRSGISANDYSVIGPSLTPKRPGERVKTNRREWPVATILPRVTHEMSPDQRRELSEMAQRLEDLIAERAAADEPAMIARLDQALADLQAAAANKAAPEAKLAIEAAGRLENQRAEKEAATSYKGSTLWRSNSSPRH